MKHSLKNIALGFLALTLPCLGWSEAVATWTGFAENLTQENYELTVGEGNTGDATSVTIGAESTNGISLKRTTSGITALTVSMTVSDIPTSEKITLVCLPVTSGAKVSLAYENGTLKQLWNTDGNYGSFEWTSTGVHRITFAYSSTGGTTTYIDGVQVMSNGTLKTGSTSFQTFTLGAYASSTNVAKGMKIHNISLYESSLNASDASTDFTTWYSGLTEYAATLTGNTLTWGSTTPTAEQLAEGRVNLTATDTSTWTLSSAMEMVGLNILGEGSVTLANNENSENTLTATVTLVNADTDVSGITASLGAVTIAEGATLTVGPNTTFSIASNAGVLEYKDCVPTDFDLNTTGAKVRFIGTATGETNIKASNGTVEIAEGAQISVPHLRFLNRNDTGDRVTFNVNGTVNVTSTSTNANVWAENNSNKGILFGHYKGQGTYNINADGQLLGNAAYLELVYTAEAQTLNVQGGTLQVRGLYANNGNATVNLSQNGTLRLAEFPTGGSNFAQNYGYGTLAAYSYNGSTGWTNHRPVSFTDKTNGTTLDPASETIAFTGPITDGAEGGGAKIIVNDSGDGTGIVNLSSVTLPDTLRYVVNRGTLILPGSAKDASVDVTSGTLKLYVTQENAMAGITATNVTLPDGENIIFVLPSGLEIEGEGSTLPQQVYYTYTATAANSTWETVGNWQLDGVTLTEASQLPGEDAKVIISAPNGTTLTLADAKTVKSLLIQDGAVTLSGGSLTTEALKLDTALTVNNALTINSTRTEDHPLSLATTNLTIGAEGSLTTSGYIDITGGTYSGSINVVSGNLSLAPTNNQGITGSLTIHSGATFTNTRESDAIDYSGSMGEINVYGTLNLGSTRWTTGKTTINLYGGATITGDGDNTGFALDYHADATLNIKKDENVLATSTTIAATIKRKEGGTLTLNVDEGMSVELTKNIDLGQPIQKAGTGEATISGVISSNGKLQVNAGTLVLSATNTYIGGTEIAEDATVNITAINQLSTSGAIVVNGRLVLTPPSGQNDSGSTAYGTADAPRLTGTGTLEIAGDGFFVIPAGFTTSLALENNREGGIVVPNAPGITVGTLSGTGYFRSDWGNTARTITVNQSAASTFSGYINAYNDGNRALTLLVTKADGVADEVDTTLTLNAENAIRTAGSTLSIAAGATVAITKANALGSGNTSGAGTLVLNYTLTGSGNPATIATLNRNGLIDNTKWTGTVEVRNAPNMYLDFASLGNDKSTVRLNGFSGYTAQSAGEGTQMNTNIEIGANGLTIANGNSGNLAIIGGKLSGFGTITMRNNGSTAIAPRLVFPNGTGALGAADSFTGDIFITGTDKHKAPGLIFGTASNADGENPSPFPLTLGSDDAAISEYEPDGKISIAPRATANVVGEWTATYGVHVYGTLGGTGTIGSALTFNNGATLDASNGALTVTGDVTYGENAKITIKLPADIATTPVLKTTSTTVPTNYTLMQGDVEVKTLMLVAKTVNDVTGFYAVEPTVSADVTNVNVKDSNLTAIKAAAAAAKVQTVSSIEGAVLVPADGDIPAKTVDLAGLELFENIPVEVVGGTATIKYAFGITAIKLEANGKVTVTATVSKIIDGVATLSNDSTDPKIASGVTVELYREGVNDPIGTTTLTTSKTEVTITSEDSILGTLGTQQLTVKVTNETTNESE